MSKSRKKIDDRQMNLFDFLQKLSASAATPAVDEGSLDISDRLRRSLTEAIKQSNLSRWELAGRMSHLLGREVTKYTLDTWTAESKEYHRMPAEFLPAFCQAAKCLEPLRVMAEAAGMFALPGPDALRSEIQRLAEEERRIRAEKRKRELFLSEMEDRSK
jgi:hypothetical protein